MTPRHLVAALCLALAGPRVVAVEQGLPTPAPDGQHDFDWEWGRWLTKVRVLQNPLSGEPARWAEFSGTSVVTPLLDGKANFVELKVKGAGGTIEGGSLRLYSPRSHQWSLNFANARDGLLTAPVYGRFDKKGVGTFAGTDTANGKAILVRFVVTRPSADSARFEQAYSADGGATWELNWIATDTRVR
ncbi:hypothetical protein [Lutibacter sp. SG786]|uniref:hypothetical protein n=1 Tax=Luteibacter sp. SG786 TaxID=2587130 RepID=UPI00141FA32C|nr:hypothetical protein [Luteibacter sp. SG786]